MATHRSIGAVKGSNVNHSAYTGRYCHRILRVSPKVRRNVGVTMGKQPSTSRKVDVTYVKRGQLAAITRLQPGAPSQRAQQALDAARRRRSTR